MNSDIWTRMRETEQAMHATSIQRQSLQAQLTETEHALGALPHGGDAYRIIGQLMVKRDAAALREELTERKSALHARLDAVSKQEKELRAKLDEQQRQVVKGDDE
jgi:prefoldin beta subunit